MKFTLEELKKAVEDLPTGVDPIHREVMREIARVVFSFKFFVLLASLENGRVSQSLWNAQGRFRKARYVEADEIEEVNRLLEKQRLLKETLFLCMRFSMCACMCEFVTNFS